MLRACAFVAVLGVLFGPFAQAAEHGTRALVVACDTKAKTITFKHADEKGAWHETVAAWDDETKWARSGDTAETQYVKRPATAALAAELKKDTKIYIVYVDAEQGGKTRIASVAKMFSGAEITQ